MPLALLLTRTIFNLTTMLDDRGPAGLAKWPFYLADILLSAVIIFVLYQLGTFEGTTEMVIVGVCLAAAAVAAWISVLPWLKEHEATVHLSNSSNLKSSVEQIKSVEKVADLIRQSNAQWQSVQETSARTVTSAREITDKMKLEADEFMKFISQAHDQERAGLRLEVEKLRRMEADWIKVAVQMLDHVFALTRAAERSGQIPLIKQLHQFQTACRDVARRMGLATFAPVLGEPFEPRAHQLPNPQMAAQEGDRIQDVLATGFTYQGQLLRRALVVLEGSEGEAQKVAPVSEEVLDEVRTQEESAAPGGSAQATQILAEEGSSTEPTAEITPALVEDKLAGDISPEPPNESQSKPGIERGNEAGDEIFEEPPAIIDTYAPRAEEDHLESAEEEQGQIPAEEPDSRSPRAQNRSGQEELPF